MSDECKRKHQALMQEFQQAREALHAEMKQKMQALEGSFRQRKEALMQECRGSGPQGGGAWKGQKGAR